MIKSLDHLVLTVEDISRTVDFYTKNLGMIEVTFGQGRKALSFGNQKINLHQKGHEYLPNARQCTVGSADLCFVASLPIEAVIKNLNAKKVIIEEGPVERTGAIGKIISIYIRDPDGNLLEISEYLQE